MEWTWDPKRSSRKVVYTLRYPDEDLYDAKVYWDAGQWKCSIPGPDFPFDDAWVSCHSTKEYAMLQAEAWWISEHGTAHEKMAWRAKQENDDVDES